MPNQTQQKSAHIIPVINVKPANVAVAASSPRATAIIARKGKKNHFFFHRLIFKFENEIFCLSIDLRTEVQQMPTIQRPTSPISRPDSSDGSTTVSATSSPGIDQQEQEELNALYQVKLRMNCISMLEVLEK